MLKSSTFFLFVVLFCSYRIITDLPPATAQGLPPPGNGLSTTITADRTAGVAPLAVIADLEVGTRNLGGDFINASFITDFDSTRANPTTTRSTKGGFLAGHVYEKSGSYRIHSHVLDITGATAAAEPVTLNVQDPEVFYANNTYCFSTTERRDFSGCPTADPGRRIITDNLQQALDYGGPNRRLLLDRFATWRVATISIRAGSGQTIAAFPNPGAESSPKPRVISTASNHAFVLAANNLRDLKIMDLHIVGSWTPAMTSSPNLSGISVEGSEQVLVYRVLMEGLSATAFYTGFRSRSITLAKSTIRNSRDYGGYGGANGLLILDNIIDNLYGTQHGFRVQGGQNSIFYGNEFTNLWCYTSITPRGHNWKTVISNNLLHQIVAPNPQNSTSYEIVAGVLIEGNRISPPPGVEKLRAGISATSYFTTVRNNTFINNDTAVFVRDHPLVGGSGNIAVYNNTYYNQATPVNHEHTFLSVERNAQAIFFFNNLFYSTSNVSYAPVLSFSAPDAQLYSSHNIIQSPNQGATWRPFRANNRGYTLSEWQGIGKDAETLIGDAGFVSVDPSSANFLRLRPSSLATDSALGINLALDRDGTVRPIDGNGDGIAQIDRGALEAQ